MKLYNKTTKRIYKKRVGGYCKKYTIDLLKFGASLKAGDSIFTCKGYNQVIEKIVPVKRCISKNSWFIVDFDIYLTDGGRCSLNHCCEEPYSKQQLIEYWDSIEKQGLSFTRPNLDENGFLIEG